MTDRKKEEESFVQDCRCLVCHRSEPCPQLAARGRGRRLRSRAAGVGWLQKAEQVGSSLKTNDLLLPSPLQERSHPLALRV